MAEEFEEVEEETTKGRGPQPPRVSITLPHRIRRKLRIAAAKADMEVVDWCRTVLVTAADRTVKKIYPDEI